MELKIRIKEVEECGRLLTDEENCCGFETEDGRLGVFRKETIRDATFEEIVAWHTMRIYDACQFITRSCRGCPKSGRCTIHEDYNASKLLIGNKEIISEVV